MTGGTPLSPGEQQYIIEHIDDGPANIAHHLGQEFSAINGGFRKRDTVKKFIRRVRAGPPVVIEVPTEIVRAARETGISAEQIRFIAIREILVRIGKKEVSHGRTL